MPNPPRDRAPSTSNTYFVAANAFAGQVIFQSERMAKLLLETSLDCRSQRKYLLHEFMIMLNHLHILFTTEAGVTLGCAVQFVKGAFSRRAGKRLEMDASKGEALQMRFDSCSLSFWNETRHTGIHHWIQPLSGLDSINLVKRVCRKRRNVEILSRARRTPGRSKQSRAALHRPSQQYLRRRLSHSRRDPRNNWIFKQPRLHPVTQWRKSQKHNALLLAEFQ